MRIETKDLQALDRNGRPCEVCATHMHMHDWAVMDANGFVHRCSNATVKLRFEVTIEVDANEFPMPTLSRHQSKHESIFDHFNRQWVMTAIRNAIPGWMDDSIKYVDAMRKENEDD